MEVSGREGRLHENVGIRGKNLQTLIWKLKNLRYSAEQMQDTNFLRGVSCFLFFFHAYPRNVKNK